MKFKRAITLGTVTLLSALFLANGTVTNANASSKYAKDQTVTWTESQELATNDLAKATDTESFNVLLNTQSGLYRLKDSGHKIVNDLATSTKISKDGKTYTVKLRHNAKWSNGAPLTAQDFVYSWQRTLDPKTASQDAFYMYQVENAEAVNKGQKPLSALGIKANGKYQLTIHLTKPVSYFQKLLAWPLFFPVNKKVATQEGSKFGTSAKNNVYSGAFKLTGWTGTNSKWTLAKNGKYWDNKHVHLNKINEQVVKDPSTGLNEYQSHKIDETVLSGEQVANFKGHKDFVSRKSSNGYRLDFNQKKVKAFQNVNVRKAFSLALNRKDLVNNVLSDGSVVPQGFAPTGIGTNPKSGKDFAKSAYVKSGVTYNLSEAKKLLKQGYKQTGTKSIKTEVLTTDDDAGKNVGEFIQSQLEKLPNVKVSVVNLPKTAQLAREKSGNFQLIIGGWQSVFADPINFLDIWESTSPYNFSGWNNKQYDTLLSASENSLANKPEDRWNNLVKAEKLLMTQQGTAPLFQKVQAQLLNTKVKDVNYNPSGVPYDWKDTYIAK